MKTATACSLVLLLALPQAARAGRAITLPFHEDFDQQDYDDLNRRPDYLTLEHDEEGWDGACVPIRAMVGNDLYHAIGFFHGFSTERLNVGYLIYFGPTWFADGRGNDGNDPKTIIFGRDTEHAEHRAMQKHKQDPGNAANRYWQIFGDNQGWPLEHRDMSDGSGWFPQVVHLTDRIGEWVYVETEVDLSAEPGRGLMKLWLTTADGAFNETQILQCDVSFPGVGTWAGVDFIGAYQNNTSTDDGAWFRIDELRIADHYLGPPPGFVTGGPGRFHVDAGHAGCSDDGPGSQAAPWCTLTHACATLEAGETVHVHAGTYEAPGSGERWLPAFAPVNSGAPGAPIVFQAHPGDEVHLRLSSGAGPVMGSSGRSHIVWDGFIVHEQTSAPDTGPVIITGNHVTVQNCEIICVYQEYQDNHSGIRIEGDIFGGPHLVGTLIRNNVIHGVYGNWSGNQAGVITYAMDDSIIENNTFYDSEEGIFIKGADNTNNIVRYNLFHDLGSGVRVYHGYDIQVYQNVFRDSVSGFLVYGGSGNVDVTNNTIYNCDNGQFSNAWDVSDVEVRNNIFSTCTPHAYAITDNLLQNLTADCNLFHDSGDFWTIDGDSIAADLTSWQDTTGQDPGSASFNPLFVDAADDDFRLQAGSPAIDFACDGGSVALGAYITGDEVIGADRDATGPVCGDGSCNGTETCASCPGDCGACPGCQDGDGDGYGNPASADCDNPEADCDDGDEDVHPGAAEACNAVDDDCDAQTDEDWPDLGTACAAGVGACEASGQVACLADGTGAACDAVPGDPSDEVCGNDVDEDCDGVLDNGACPCTAGDERPCYTGPADTEAVGECRAGVQACEAGTWSSTCDGEVIPVAESCADSLDNDCDGDTDGSDSDCEEPCADADGDGHANAVCGGDDCNDSDAAVHPGAEEICDDGRDDDCDGDVDEDCADEVNGGCGCGVRRPGAQGQAGTGSGLLVALGALALTIPRRRIAK